MLRSVRVSPTSRHLLRSPPARPTDAQNGAASGLRVSNVSAPIKLSNNPAPPNAASDWPGPGLLVQWPHTPHRAPEQLNRAGIHHRMIVDVLPIIVQQTEGIGGLFPYPATLPVQTLRSAWRAHRAVPLSGPLAKYPPTPNPKNSIGSQQITTGISQGAIKVKTTQGLGISCLLLRMF